MFFAAVRALRLPENVYHALAGPVLSLIEEQCACQFSRWSQSVWVLEIVVPWLSRVLSCGIHLLLRYVCGARSQDAHKHSKCRFEGVPLGLTGKCCAKKRCYLVWYTIVALLIIEAYIFVRAVRSLISKLNWNIFLFLKS